MPITGGGAGGGLEYVDRGDSATFDFTNGDFTIDGNWYDLDLSGIITDSDAVLVHFTIYIRDGSAGKRFLVREDGNSNNPCSARTYTQTADQYAATSDVLPIDSNRIVEYNIFSGTDDAGFIVRGWWKPA